MKRMPGDRLDVSAATTPPDATNAYALEATDVAAALGTDPSAGLTSAEAASRLARFGPNQITAGEAAVDPGGGADPVAGPDEHHARRGHRGEFR